MGTSRVQMVREEGESRSREVRLLHAGYGTVGVGILTKQRASKSASERKNLPHQLIRLSRTRCDATAGREEEGKLLFSGAA